MLDTPKEPEHVMRTGDFFFRVWRQNSGAWNWRLHVEVVETGEWGIFDSMEEALWFMRQHMTMDEDAEADVDPTLPACESGICR
jgi:hypothetical protein